MTDQLEIIDRLISDHHGIRDYVRLVGDSLNDFEALFSLQRAHADWTQAPVENLSSKKLQLRQALRQIDEGFTNHSTDEEKSLALLFGQAFTKAPEIEHLEIIKEIEGAEAVVDFGIDIEHQEITSQIIECLQRSQTHRLPELIVEASQIRNFLGQESPLLDLFFIRLVC